MSQLHIFEMSHNKCSTQFYHGTDFPPLSLGNSEYENKETVLSSCAKNAIDCDILKLEFHYDYYMHA